MIGGTSPLSLSIRELEFLKKDAVEQLRLYKESRELTGEDEYEQLRQGVLDEIAPPKGKRPSIWPPIATATLDVMVVGGYSGGKGRFSNSSKRQKSGRTRGCARLDLSSAQGS